MQISEDLVSDFKKTWTHIMNQMIHGVGINDTHLHLMKKLNAMMNQDYKELYHLEKIEHEWTKSELERLPTNTGYGYFTGVEESVIYPVEMDNTLHVYSDYTPPCGSPSPIDAERCRSAFRKVNPDLARINLEGPF
jgi:hypothetical protein